MDEFIGALTGGVIWGVGFGLALGLTRTAAGGLRPLIKDAMKGAVAVQDWVSTTVEQGKESVEDLYHEAQAERESEADPADAESGR